MDDQRAFAWNTSFTPLLQPAAICNRRTGQMWLIGGSISLYSGHSNAVWTSSDMIHWYQINSSATGFTPRAAAASAMDSNGVMYLAAGVTYNSPTHVRALNDVWISTDAITWNITHLSAPFQPRSGARLSIVR